MARIRLTKPDPNRRHPHPHEQSATQTLRRHFAVVKALLVIFVVGTGLWVGALVALMVTLRFGFGVQLHAFIGYGLILVSFYIAYIGMLAILPIKY